MCLVKGLIGLVVSLIVGIIGLVIAIVVGVISLVVGIFGGTIGADFVRGFVDSVEVTGEIPGVTTTVERTEEESATIAAVEKVQPAVVSIVVTKDLSKIYEEYYQDNFFFPFFDISSPPSIQLSFIQNQYLHPLSE